MIAPYMPFAMCSATGAASAVIHEGSRDTRDEAITERVVRHEIHVRPARRDFRCVKVQTVGHRGLVDEREFHGVALGNPKHGTGNAAVERPGIVRHAVGDCHFRVPDRDA